VFTGIIEERGEVLETSAHRLTVGARTVSAGATLGESLSVSGCCLTVIENTGETLTFDLAITGIDPEAEGGARIKVDMPAGLMRYVVEKGSVSVDGISMTVATLGSTGIEIAVIPHTLAATTLGVAAIGDPVNIEVDIIAKYVERLMEGQRS
jgi:riboflavin synthase